MEWNMMESMVFDAVIKAAAIILIGFIIGKVLGRIAARILREVELNSTLKKAGLKADIESIISGIISYFVYLVTLIMALNQLGLTTTMLYMIAGAILVIFVISLSLAIKDFIPNFIAGIRMLYKQDINVGEKIKVNDIEGKVVKIALLETHIETKKNDLILVPNSILMKNKVIKRR